MKYELSSFVFWVLVVCAAYVMIKHVAPTLWKLGVLLVRVVFMFIEGKENDFPMWPVVKDLPRTLWRVWRADMNTCYDYTDVCRFNFYNGKFESTLTADYVWLDKLALALRQGKNVFKATFVPDDATFARGVENPFVVLDCAIHPVNYSSGIFQTLVFKESAYIGTDSYIGFSLRPLIEVLKHYAPHVHAVAVITKFDVVDHVSTLESVPMTLNGDEARLFVINSATIKPRA